MKGYVAGEVRGGRELRALGVPVICTSCGVPNFARVPAPQENE